MPKKHAKHMNMKAADTNLTYIPYNFASPLSPPTRDVTSTPAPLKPIPLQSFSEFKDATRSSDYHVTEDQRSRTESRTTELKSSLSQGLTCSLLWMSFVILMGTSFQFGYNLGVLNQPIYLIKNFYNSTYTQRYGELNSQTLILLWSLTTMLYLPGGMIGAFIAGYVADSCGRKKAILIANMPGLIGAVISYMCVLLDMPEMLKAGRFATGFSCGMATQLAPMYLAEIAPFNLRGSMGTANQLFITLGILCGSVLGLEHLLGTITRWPYLLLINTVPAVMTLLFLPCLPESPRYLLINLNLRAEAEKALQYLRGRADVTADMEEMDLECDVNSDSALSSRECNEIMNARLVNNKRTYSLCDLLTARELRAPLIIAVTLQIIQQLSGINAVIFYSKGIYMRAGLPVHLVSYSVVVTNAVNVLMTLIAVPIMDRAGRRALLLYPMIIMSFVLAILVCSIKFQAMLSWSSYVSVGCVLVFVVCFSVGLGPIPMMIGAELFRQGPRPRALSLAGLTNWLFTALIAIGFEPVQEILQEFTFLIFLGCIVLFTFFVYFKVPETKNKTFQEIAQHFQSGGQKAHRAGQGGDSSETGDKLALLNLPPNLTPITSARKEKRILDSSTKKENPTFLGKPPSYVPYVHNPDIKIITLAMAFPSASMTDPKSQQGCPQVTGGVFEDLPIKAPQGPGDDIESYQGQSDVFKVDPTGPQDPHADSPRYYIAAEPAVDDQIETVMVEQDGIYISIFAFNPLAPGKGLLIKSKNALKINNYNKFINKFIKRIYS